MKAGKMSSTKKPEKKINALSKDSILKSRSDWFEKVVKDSKRRDLGLFLFVYYLFSINPNFFNGEILNEMTP